MLYLTEALWRGLAAPIPFSIKVSEDVHAPSFYIISFFLETGLASGSRDT